MWGFRVPVSVRLAWVLVRPAPVLSTLVSISLAQPETLAFQATAAALLTVSELADRSGSKLDRQFLDQKAAVALANIIRQLWVGCVSSINKHHGRQVRVGKLPMLYLWFEYLTKRTRIANLSEIRVPG